MYKKVSGVLFMSLVALMSSSTVALAAEEGAKGGSQVALAALMIAAGLGIGLAALGTGIGQGHAISSAAEGVARNPAASGKIMTTMLIGLAMIESLAIYALVISLILIFANPFANLL